MTRLFLTPFAKNGDVEAIPDREQTSGDVSFEKGYGFDYERDPASDPLAKTIERQKMNWLFQALSETAGVFQTVGTFPFITPDLNGGAPFAYAQGARVLYNGATYESLVDANTAEPTDATKWRGTTARTLTNNTTWYVRTDGDDASNGTTPETAFRTVQAALDHVAANFNLDRYNGAIDIGPGTFQQPVILARYNSTTGIMVLTGAGIDKTVITSNDGVTVNSARAAGHYQLRNLTIQANVTADPGASGGEFMALRVVAGTNLTLHAVKTAVDIGADMTSGSVAAIYLVGGEVTMYSMGGVNSAITVNGDGRGVGILQQRKSQFVMIADIDVAGSCSIFIDSSDYTNFTRHAGALPVFSGTITGRRYRLRAGALVANARDVATFFPGTSDGTADSTVIFL